MVLVIFSDIHGNQYAFHEFVKQLKKVKYDGIIFCGDILGYYYGQEEIITQLKDISGLYAVRGNHDLYGLRLRDGELDKHALCEKYGHSYNMLSNDVLEYLEMLPEQIEFEFQGKKYLVVHGTALDRLEGRLYPKDEISWELAEKYKQYDVVFSGHTHFKMDRLCGTTRIINPGSLGQQRDGCGFGYAIYDTEKLKLTYQNIKFELEELEKEIALYDCDNHKLRSILHRGEK
ncbi:MAG: metallophosphatase family protein [Ruminococcus flavefaciens]|nr:metallophosphatase family protein [Ruminococcus flavefaciens]